MNYLELNLTKDVQGLYFKTLLREIKDINGEKQHVHELEDSHC